jgi:DNA-binding response OmpR family regulator
MHRILIIDDQRDVRQVLRAGLETLKANLSIVDVPSAEEGMLVLARDPYDLLVVDVRLPGISGLELRAWAQVKNPDLKLIIITGSPDASTRQQVLDAPVDAYFFKPIQMGEFLSTVESMLGLPSSTPASREAVAAAGRKSVAGANTPTPDPVRAVKHSSEPNGLVFSAHDPETKRQQAQTPETMAVRLSRFRQEMEAVSAIILDENGQVAARAGGLPDTQVESKLLAALAACLRSTAAAARLLGGSEPNSLLVMHTSEYEITLAAIGASWGLVSIAARTDPSPERQALGLERTRAAAASLLSILGEQTIPLASADLPQAPAAAADPAPDEADLPDLDALFDRANITHVDVDAFWENLVEEEAEKLEDQSAAMDPGRSDD